VGLSERLWNLARAELGAARRRVADGLTSKIRQAFDGVGAQDHRFDDDPDPFEAPPPPPRRSIDPELRRYYANLELPEGASLAEVKAAYRRLVRTYHPDRHAGDPDAARITMELRTAYEQLTRHLETESDAGRRR
jgi:DnaJ-domain-containing protein 1